MQRAYIALAILAALRELRALVREAFFERRLAVHAALWRATGAGGADGRGCKTSKAAGRTAAVVNSPL